MTALKRRIAVFTLIAIAVLLALFPWLAPGVEDQPENKPWQEILLAARSIQGDRYNYLDLGPAGAKVFAQSNEVILATIRTNLRQDLRVPVKYSRAWMTSHMERWPILNALCIP